MNLTGAERDDIDFLVESTNDIDLQGVNGSALKCSDRE